MNLSCIHIFIKVNACKYPPQLEDSVYNPSYSLPIGGFSNNYLSHIFGNPPFRRIIHFCHGTYSICPLHTPPTPSVLSSFAPTPTLSALLHAHSNICTCNCTQLCYTYV